MSQPTPEKLPQLEISDQIPESLHPLLDAVVRHRKPVVIGAAVVLVLVVCFGAWRWYDAHSAKSASTRLGDILTQTTGEERAKRLTAFLADSPGHLATAARIELAAALMDHGDYAKAADAFDALIKGDDPDVKALAQLGKARCLLLGSKPGDARALLDGLRTGAPEAYRPAMQRLFAVAAEQAGDRQAALAAYKDLVANASPQEAGFLEFKITQLSGTN
ncbi:MAG: tetratricopeptide repeat protein [Desulfovibrionaceae bacterium]